MSFRPEYCQRVTASPPPSRRSRLAMLPSLRYALGCNGLQMIFLEAIRCRGVCVFCLDWIVVL